MTMIRDDSDLDSLSPEQREMRLKVRREIEAKIAHIGESTTDRYYRERYEAKRAEFQRPEANRAIYRNSFGLTRYLWQASEQFSAVEFTAMLSPPAART